MSSNIFRLYLFQMQSAKDMKIAVVTGCSRGIGLALVPELVKNNFKVRLMTANITCPVNYVSLYPISWNQSMSENMIKESQKRFETTVSCM